MNEKLFDWLRLVADPFDENTNMTCAPTIDGYYFKLGKYCILMNYTGAVFIMSPAKVSYKEGYYFQGPSLFEVATMLVKLKVDVKLPEVDPYEWNLTVCPHCRGREHVKLSLCEFPEVWMAECNTCDFCRYGSRGSGQWEYLLHFWTKWLREP